MKRRLLDWILCPACGERPRLQVFREEEVTLPAPVGPGPACSFHCALHGVAVAELAAPPGCDGCYRREVVAGLLACSCGLVYPIVDGIPRMLRGAAAEHAGFLARHRAAPAAAGPGPAVVPIAGPGPAAPIAGDGPPTADPRSGKSFGLQWALYQDGDLTWFKDDAGLRKREFLYNVDATPAELAGRTLLDAGCGNGELTRSIAEYGLEVAAMDFSKSVEGARRRLLASGSPVAHRVHYLQGNVLELPLLPRSFDVVHSSGVLHHTPSTERALRSVARAVKPGGKLYVQLYRRREAWVHAVNVSLRAVTTRLPLGLLYGLCWTAAPAHAALSRLVHRLRGEGRPPASTRRERAVQMFDNYSPKYQYRHTVPEIMSLMRSEGYEHLKDVTLDNEARHMLAVLGSKARAVGSGAGSGSDASLRGDAEAPDSAPSGVGGAKVAGVSGVAALG